MMEKKRQEIIEMEKHCLPTRHYLMKFILPNITDGLVEVAKIRPKNAVEFLAKFMLSRGNEIIDEEEEKIDEEIINEFRKLCNQRGGS